MLSPDRLERLRLVKVTDLEDMLDSGGLLWIGSTKAARQAVQRIPELNELVELALIGRRSLEG